MKKQGSIKIKLIVIIFLITIVPLVFSSFFQVLNFDKMNIKQVEEYQKDIVNMKSENITRWLDDKCKTLNTIYTLHPEFLKSNKDNIIGTLNKIKHNYHDIKDICYADKEGNLYDSNGANINISEEAHFKQASKKNAIVISDVFVSKIDGDKIVVFDKPILDDAGNFNGIIQIVVNAEFLDKLIKEIKIGENGYGYLISQNGNYLIHKKDNILGKNLKDVDSYTNNILMKSMEKKDLQFLNYKNTLDGTKYLSAYKKIKNTTWVLVIVSPKNEILQGIHNSIKISLSILLITLILVTILSLIIIKRISALIFSTKDLIMKTSNFDLAYENKYKNFSNRKDELGAIFRALGNMRQSLRDIVSKIKENSLKVNANSDALSINMEDTSIAIGDISKASENLAFSSTDLARSVEMGVSKLDNLALEINHITELASKVKDYMKKTEEINNSGFKHVDILQKSVKSNNESTNKLFSEIENLEEKSNSITSITDTIKGITSQINLLSLNAAIEAARAGENGRGFAVVAEEIRKLANETNISTKKIEDMVSNMINAVSLIRSEINNTTSSIEKMNESSVDTKKVFENINHGVLNMVVKINDLTDNIYKIDENKKDVLTYMENMSAISEEMASTTEEVSASVQQQTSNIDLIVENTTELKNITLDLQNLVSQFIV